MAATDSRTKTAIARALDKTIVAATSSLDSFAIDLDDGQALLIKASSEEGEAAVEIACVNAESLEKKPDAVCSVDWSWICGSKIMAVDAGANTIRLKLDPAGPLTVAVAFWQGSPFL